MEEILHQLIGSFSYYSQGFIHPRWLGFLPSTLSHQPSRDFVRYWDAFFKKRDYTEAYEHLGTVGPRRWSPDWCKIYTTSETTGSGSMAIQLEVFGGDPTAKSSRVLVCFEGRISAKKSSHWAKCQKEGIFLLQEIGRIFSLSQAPLATH